MVGLMLYIVSSMNYIFNSFANESKLSAILKYLDYNLKPNLKMLLNSLLSLKIEEIIEKELHFYFVLKRKLILQDLERF